MAMLGLDGRFLAVNASLCAFLGRDEPTLLASALQSLTHLEDLGTSLSADVLIQASGTLPPGKSGSSCRVDLDAHQRGEGFDLLARWTSARCSRRRPGRRCARL